MSDKTSVETSAEPELGSPWEDLRAYIAQPRLASLQLAPSGDWLLLGVDTLSTDATTHRRALWRLGTDGSAPRRLTRGVEGEAAQAVLRDGSVAFTAKRSVPSDDADDDTDDQALWLLPAGGGEARVVARRRGGFSSVTTCRESDRVVLGFGMRPGVDEHVDDQARRRRRATKKVHATLHEASPVRFWDHDMDGDTLRLVAVTFDEDAPALRGEALQPATADLGQLPQKVLAVSSDGSFAIVQCMVAEPRGERRESLARVDLATGELEMLLDADGQAFGANILFGGGVLSDDDRWLACTRSVRSTPDETVHEFLHLVDLSTGAGRDVAADWPRWGEAVGFSPDASTLFVVADEDGERPVFAIDLATDQVRRLTQHGAHSSVQPSRDGQSLFALRSAWDEPGCVVCIDVESATSTVLYAPDYPALPGRLERIETTAPDGTRIPSWLVLPDGCDDDHPAPLALWVHGGPLNSWNAWSWRWCPWLLVSQGWAVLLPDPALSTGYGRDFVQRGWGHWGKATYSDVMAATDAVEARADIDAEHTIMMGGSFGGYMANWIAGHTDRFKAIVSHASLWNLETFGSTTDAAWFWDRELSPQMRTKYSPHLHADKITTPMLVIHGDRDYRVPIGEGLALWWALVQNHDGDPATLPHKFLYFPDECHWVLQPQHAIVWYETVRAFLQTHAFGEEFIASTML